MTFTDVAATRRRDKTRLIGHSGRRFGVMSDLQEEAFGSYLKRFDGQSKKFRADRPRNHHGSNRRHFTRARRSAS